MSYDVIVIGSGPAGATAAYFLGEAGARVLLLEKERLPRYKACGGGVSTAVLAQFPFSFDPVIESRVRAVTYKLWMEAATIEIPDGEMCMVMRDRFDRHILAHARAEVIEGKPVQAVAEEPDRVTVLCRDGDRFEAPFVVGADGANSIVARSLGLRRRRTMGAAIEAEVPAPPEVWARFAGRPMFIFGEVPNGYLWVFPKADHLSVGIGGLQPAGLPLQTILKTVAAREGIPLANVPLHGHPLPIRTWPGRISTRRVLLAGDAAGLVDPFSGEGIRHAIGSGRLAAEAILAGRPAQYSARIARRTVFDTTIGLGVAILFYNLTWPCFELGARNPYSTRAFLDMFTGRSGYIETMLAVFGTMPFFLATETVALLAGAVVGAKTMNRIRRAAYFG